jgi:serine-type D-Ala-D-Ala carboxypeptidase (penicillin-binding protein 5/6)
VIRPLDPRRAIALLVVGSWVLGTVALVTSAGAASPEGPPPTPVAVAGGGTSPSPFPQALRTPEPSTSEPPDIRALSAVLMDLDTGQVLYSLDPAQKRAIASLTKIMTAYLVLSRSSPSDLVTVSDNAASGRIVGISGLGLVDGEEISVEHLLYALLLQSANDAAVALAENVSGDVEPFVKAMNRTAARLGMTRTRFASPNGLDDAGYSTARDLATLTRAAYGLHGFADIVATRFHTIPAPSGHPRVVQNRNALLWLYPGAIGVKTGYTSAAGFNVVAAADRGDQRLVAVVLGEPGEPFSDAAALLDYGFAAFDRRPLIRDDADLGSVEVDGHEVDVASGAALDGLVPTDARVRREVVVAPTVRFPPGRGQTIGSVVMSVPGLTLGQVPLVVTDVEPPPPLDDDRPWWARAAGSVVHAGGAFLDALFG